MKTLGVYLGPTVISIVETKGNTPINNIQILQSIISPDKLSEEKVPREIKIATLLKDELRKNKIEAGEAVVSLSGKDLIVRTFEMPILPRQELDTAVKFEIKKYIPFKIENLISDFQYELDKTIQKIRVLFVGIKKETLDEYCYIFSQSGLKIKSIEYSAFSLLRLLKLANIKEKGAIAVVNIDLVKDDEANFVVLENGFPLFSRDINLMGGSEEVIRNGETQLNDILEKLKREIQVSIDYYGRKFPSKNIGKIFFITNPDYQNNLDAVIKELGLGIQFIDANKYMNKPSFFSLASIKSYSGSLFKINTAIKINLLLAKDKAAEEVSMGQTAGASWARGFKLNPVFVLACLLVYLATFLFGAYRTLPLQKELKNIINMRPAVSTVSSPGLSYEELVKINSDYKAEIGVTDNIIKKRLYLTSLLDAIAALTPKGIWLVNLSFKKEAKRAEVVLEGAAYLGNSNAELELVNTFLSHLKENPVFSKYFKEISVVSADYNQSQKINRTNFVISCRDYENPR